MVDPTTSNLQLAQPTRGSDVGTWDVPVNNNTGFIDQAFGGVTALALGAVDVNLTSSQAYNNVIRLTGNLTNQVIINLTNIYKFWTIDNQITNSLSSFAVRIMSTSGGSVLGVAPGVSDIFYDGTSVKYRNLGKLGEYWDYAGTTVPTWVSLCTVPPYLNCNGTSFSSATYPQLANFLGTTTLPDTRGRIRAANNQGTTRILSSNGGVDGNTNFSGGGADTTTLASSNLPPYTPSGSVSVANVQLSYRTAGAAGTAASYVDLIQPSGLPNTIQLNQPAATFTGNAQGGTSNPFTNMPPTYVGGITMIKAI